MGGGGVILREHSVRGDCSVRIDGLGFGSEEIAACMARQGLLALELELAGEKCTCIGCGGAAAGLSPAEIGDAVRQAKELGARRIILVNGEVNLYPHLEQVIDDIRGLGMEVEFFSLGAGITAAIALFLSSADVSVVVGLDSMSREVQDRMADWDGAFDAAQAAL